MRLLPAWVTLLAACAGADVVPVGDDVDVGDVIDLDGAYGPERAPPRRVRAVHLRFDLGPAAVSFNETGVVVADDVPPGGVTPFLPLPTESASLQVLQEGVEVAASEVLDLPPGGFGLVGVFGAPGLEGSLTLIEDPTPTPDRITLRFVHTVPGLPYAGIVTATGTSLAGLAYGDVSNAITFPGDATQRWFIDINGDQVPDLPLETFDLPDTDSQGNGQVVEAFLIPTGQNFPAPINLPVPALLLVPLDAPDGIVVIAPDAG